MSHTIRRAVTASAAAAALLACRTGEAQTTGYAEPPDGRPPYVADPFPAEERAPAPRSWGARGDPVRLSIGSVGRTDGSDVRAGLFTAADLGRGPAGVRLSAAWVRVGYDDPLAQYTGELTLALFERAHFVPSIGAGGGLARTYAVDAAGRRTSGGSSLGVAVARIGLEYRLPFEGTDARAGLSAIGTFPAMRGEDAPSLSPWALVALTVGVGL